MSGAGEVNVELVSDADNAPSLLAPVEPSNGADDRHGFRWLVVVAVVLAVIAALSIAFVVRPSPKSTPPTATARPIPDAHAQFPYKTASDVVSYADHVAIVT